MPYTSKRQWRWAFATGQPWARRWADETPGGEERRFRRLPERAAKADVTFEDGSVAPGKQGAGPGGKPMSPAERARHAALVRWGKKNPFAQRLAAIQEKKKKAKGGGKGKARAAKPTAEERAAERERLRQERAAERAQIRKEKAEERAQVRAEREAEREKAKPAAGAPEKAKPAAGAEAEKKKGGGGGGKGKEAKPTEDEKKKARAEERAQTARDTAQAVGLSADEADFLRAAAEGTLPDGSFDARRLMELGLVVDDGDTTITTDQGRRALLALERGDRRGYQAALQDVRAKQERDAATQQRAAATEARRAQAEADRAKAAAEAEAARQRAERDEVAALLDDWEAGRTGLSYRDQRRAVRAGLARYDDAGNIRRVTPRETKATDPRAAALLAALAALEAP